MIGTISTIMMLAAPILIIATGGMICERSGVTNVGLDGLMSIGACTAAIVHQLMEAAKAIERWRTPFLQKRLLLTTSTCVVSRPFLRRNLSLI